MSVPSWVTPNSIAVTLLHGYLWWRLVRDTTVAGSVARRGGTVALAVLAASVPAALVAIHTLPPNQSRWFAWPGFIWYALMLYLVMLLVVAEPIRVGLAVARRRRGKTAKASAPRPASVPALEPTPVPAFAPTSVPALIPALASASSSVPPHPAEHASASGGVDAVACASTSDGVSDRRRFLARSFALTAGVGAVAVVGVGMATALGPPRLERRVVRLRRLAPTAEGCRIALISDLHLGAMLGRAHTQMVVDMVNRATPDVVAIVGDLVDGTVGQLADATAPLRQLRSRHGAFFVTGNHEHIYGAAPWIEELRALGVRPLQNERVELAPFDIAGVDDLAGVATGHGPDYDRALSDRDRSRPVVLLAHQPVQVHEAARRGVDLQLSGHTHGGQMAPLSLVTAAAQPTLAGWQRHGDTQLYVTRGTGFWGPPVRVGAPPDITILELTR